MDSIFTGKVATGKYSKSSCLATPSPTVNQADKRRRESSGDESWSNVKEKRENDEDDDDESVDSNDENKNPAVKDDHAKGIKPVPMLPRPMRVKPGTDITNFLGKILDNQDKIVKHHMADSKLDQALKIFSSKYSADLSVMERLKFKKALTSHPATPDMFLQLDEEERGAFIQANSI